MHRSAILRGGIDGARRRRRFALPFAVAGCVVWLAFLSWSQASLTPNPYEEGYDPSDLAATKGEGTAENPFRIYNIEQLQAIDGVAPAGIVSSVQAVEAATLFGVADEERFSRHYVLANDIDATATRNWNGGAGFDPIGEYGDEEALANRPFTGVFNGGGYSVRGLRINRPDTSGVGLFAVHSGIVASVGVVDARIVGSRLVGGLVGYNTGSISRSWVSGSAIEGMSQVAGLVANHAAGLIEESWFSGSLLGQSSESVDWDGRYVGGLAGESWAGDIRNAWSAGSVEGRSELGGFVGVQNGGLITAGWTASEVLAEGASRGGFIAFSKNVKESYWGKGALGQNDGGISSDPNDPREYFGVDSLQTISVSAWDAGIWDFGDSKLGEGDRNADFPILRAVDSDQQAAGIASGLTRILHTHSGGLTTLNARATTTIYTNMTLSAAVMRLDTNGPAANEGGETSNPQCSLSGGVLIADTGYNGATVRGNAANAVLSDLRSNCEFLLRPLAVPSETALTFYIVAGAVTMRRVYHLSIADGIVWENDGPPIIAGAGATVLIDALAPGLAAVTVIDADDAGARRNGAIVTYAAQSPYFAVSERGAGTVWLADSAVNLFDEDNKELTLIVTVSDGQAKPLSATAAIFFRSGPRAIDGEALTLTIGDFQRGATVLASHLVAATIRHAEESYSLDDGYGLFAANSGDGEIVLAADIVEAGEWTVVLRATSADGSVTATQRIVILALPPQDGNPYNDGYYFGESGKGEGTAENPFRIYNIEQLQAIDGVVPAEVAADLSSVEIAQALTLFGASAEERLSRHYVLANDIDATATRGWNDGKGFDPIGSFHSRSFVIFPDSV